MFDCINVACCLRRLASACYQCLLSLAFEIACVHSLCAKFCENIWTDYYHHHHHHHHHHYYRYFYSHCGQNGSIPHLHLIPLTFLCIATSQKGSSHTPDINLKPTLLNKDCNQGGKKTIKLYFPSVQVELIALVLHSKQ